MAKCEKREIKPPPPPPDEYVLTMNRREAQIVLDAVRSFGAGPSGTDIWLSIYQALWP